MSSKLAQIVTFKLTVLLIQYVNYDTASVTIYRALGLMILSVQVASSRPARDSSS